MVEGDGFEPSKAEPADLQSDPFGHSGTPPICFLSLSSESEAIISITPNLGKSFFKVFLSFFTPNIKKRLYIGSFGLKKVMILPWSCAVFIADQPYY